jgi:hypothetical protein
VAAAQKRTRVAGLGSSSYRQTEARTSVPSLHSRRGSGGFPAVQVGEKTKNKRASVDWSSSGPKSEGSSTPELKKKMTF